MAETPIPPDEAERLRDLDELGALEAPLEPDFDAVATLAAHICRAPVAMVNLLDGERQHFRGRAGTTWTGADRSSGYCQYAVCGRELLEIPDTLADPRYRENAVAQGEPYLRYYAGVPLVSGRGHALGTVCVVDHRPRLLTSEQRETLQILAESVVTMLELHRRAREAGRTEVPRPPGLERLKDRFLSSINHELRTPVTSIRSALQLLREGGLDEETERRFLLVMERNNERLLGLLDELLLVTSLNAGTAVFAPQRTDLAETVRRAVDDVADGARQRRHALRVHARSGVAVRADAERLRLALRHVLDNAVKFTPPGGAIDVVVTADPRPAVEVRDTGIGIRPEDLGHVLEDFYRAPEMEERAIGGTGLGLAIVDKIIRLHGGEVRVESEPGGGTRVRLTLPVFTGPDTGRSASPPSSPGPSGSPGPCGPEEDGGEAATGTR
ncbi:GAF domain-containing sensor histidine kinase [Planomonospora sp. ID82291]|uniref:GAF domain-containing sensor histidine kinase n=1 Tax=Planomonospora sp. ID82291 TaxID=2738136 RepID=UPI0018C3D40E|nr:GAF domain-containing sensor histidine kinase [Planomonospora sp. ID82291]MBG0815246.1 GAF domain-containing sensor histidine kinase [Planomonospora sp. ID82291]